MGSKSLFEHPLRKLRIFYEKATLSTFRNDPIWIWYLFSFTVLSFFPISRFLLLAYSIRDCRNCLSYKWLCWKRLPIHISRSPVNRNGYSFSYCSAIGHNNRYFRHLFTTHFHRIIAYLRENWQWFIPRHSVSRHFSFLIVY